MGFSGDVVLDATDDSFLTEAMFVLGMVERLSDLADPRHDAVGLELEEEHLPERIRLSRRQKPSKPESRGAK